MNAEQATKELREAGVVAVECLRKAHFPLEKTFAGAASREELESWTLIGRHLPVSVWRQ